jgi:hypothetical protein
MAASCKPIGQQLRFSFSGAMMPIQKTIASNISEVSTTATSLSPSPPSSSYPPDGERMPCWDRLKTALGTPSSAFVDAALSQLQAAAGLPGRGTSEIAVNAALAMIEAAAPRDEIEGALAVQMACTHTAAMAVLTKLGGGNGSERRVAALASAAGRLLRAYAMQVEAMRRTVPKWKTSPGRFMCSREKRVGHKPQSAP